MGATAVFEIAAEIPPAAKSLRNETGSARFFPDILTGFKFYGFPCKKKLTQKNDVGVSTVARKEVQPRSSDGNGSPEN